MQQTSRKTHDQQTVPNVFDGHGAEGRPIENIARENMASVSREAAASLTPFAHFELPQTRYARPAVNARLQRARLDTAEILYITVGTADWFIVFGG